MHTNTRNTLTLSELEDGTECNLRFCGVGDTKSCLTADPRSSMVRFRTFSANARQHIPSFTVDLFDVQQKPADYLRKRNTLTKPLAQTFVVQVENLNPPQATVPTTRKRPSRHCIDVGASETYHTRCKPYVHFWVPLCVVLHHFRAKV
jgi:hypothetical protein